MRDDAYFRDTVEKICQTREETAEGLRQRGFTVLDSATNFLFASPAEKPAKEIFEALRERGVLIRYFSAPRIDSWLRITIGTPEQMQRFFAELDAILR